MERSVILYGYVVGQYQETIIVWKRKEGRNVSKFIDYCASLKCNNSFSRKSNKVCKFAWNISWYSQSYVILVTVLNDNRQILIFRQYLCVLLRTVIPIYDLLLLKIFSMDNWKKRSRSHLFVHKSLYRKMRGYMEIAMS